MGDSRSQPIKNELRSFSQSIRDGRCLEVWFARNVTDEDRADLLAAVNSHASLKARAEQAERSVDVLESNARVQAKLLADTGRWAKELERLLREARRCCDPAGDPTRLTHAAMTAQIDAALSEVKPAGETGR